jgi:hypothetical protein
MYRHTYLIVLFFLHCNLVSPFIDSKNVPLLNDYLPKQMVARAWSVAFRYEYLATKVYTDSNKKVFTYVPTSSQFFKYFVGLMPLFFFLNTKTILSRLYTAELL